MNPERLRRVALFFSLLAMLAGCAKETLHAVIVVNTTGVDADVTALQASVTVSGVLAGELQEFTPQQSNFSLELPDGTNGDVLVSVAAIGGDGCVISSGSGKLQVSGIGRYDLTVPLMRLAAEDCQTYVVLELSGIDPSIHRLSVSADVDGAPRITGQDYPGATQQITLSLGESVRGALHVTVSGFGCQSCLRSQGTAMLQLELTGQYPLPVSLSAQSPILCPPLASNLLSPRAQHTATLLASGPYAGQVLILGGEDNMSRYLNSAELYDPRSGKSSAFGPMLVNRCLHTATVLTTGPDQGRLLITGGYDGSVLRADVEIYDPLTGRTRSAPSMSFARDSHTATLLPDGRVVIIGGNPVGNGGQSVEIYDPLTGMWSPADDAPSTQDLHTATLLSDGRILVAGGVTASFDNSAQAAIFDPAASPGSQWLSADNLVAARSRHLASLLPNGQVLVLGGHDEDGNQISSAELFAPGTRTWSLAGFMLTGRGYYAGVTLSSGQQFLTGGTDTTLNPSSFRANAELYSADLGGVAPLIPLSVPRAIHTATLLPDDGVLLIGGYSENQGSYATTDSIELLFPLACSP